MKISRYTAATTPADADITILVQGGVTKKVSLTTLAVYFGSGSSLKNNFAGTAPPGLGDDSADGYAVGSIWINTTANPKEAYRCVDASVGAAVWLNTTLEISELGSAALLDIDAATAENDFLVGGSSPVGWIRKTLSEVKVVLGIGESVPTPEDVNDFQVAAGSPLAWVKKTLAETKAILGTGSTLPATTAENDFVLSGGSPLDWVKKTLAETLIVLGIGNKADKVATSPDPDGYIAEFDSTGNLVKSAKLSSDVHASGSDNQDLTVKADKVPTSPDPTDQLAAFDASGNLVLAGGTAAQFSQAIAAKMDSVTPTAESDFLAADGSPLAWVKKTLAEVKALLDLDAKADKVPTSPDPDGSFAIFDSDGNLTVVEGGTVAAFTGAMVAYGDALANCLGAAIAVGSEDFATIVKLTQAEYDALSPVDETTLYIIVEA